MSLFPVDHEPFCMSSCGASDLILHLLKCGSNLVLRQLLRKLLIFESSVTLVKEATARIAINCEHMRDIEPPGRSPSGVHRSRDVHRYLAALEDDSRLTRAGLATTTLGRLQRRNATS